MSKEIIGIVKEVLPIVHGTGKKGDWTKEQILLEVDNGKYQSCLALWLWNENTNQLKPGNLISGLMSFEACRGDNHWINNVTLYQFKIHK